MTWQTQYQNRATDHIVRRANSRESVEAAYDLEAEADQPGRRLREAIVDAANRAEATAFLIRSGYKVYCPEADCDGEDLVVQHPSGELRAVRIKARPIVDWKRYGARRLWMLFPSAPYDHTALRGWFLILHDHFYNWVERRHLSAPKWASHWSYPIISEDLRAFLGEWELAATRESPSPERSN
jgi:hypothetical protein